MKPKKQFNPRLIAKVSLDLGVRENLVAEIGAFQSEFSRDLIKAGNLESVTWPFLGKFAVNSKQLQKGAHAFNQPLPQKPKTQ